MKLNKPIIVECIHHGKFTFYYGTNDYNYYLPIVRGDSMKPLTCIQEIDDKGRTCNDEMIVRQY